MADIKREQLIEAAKEAREKAYTPYSNFPVGAAVLTKEGKIFTGCNIENSSYGLTNCAERTAIFKAVSEGYQDFEAIAIVADSQKPVTPCGACRQVLLEFGSDIRVIMSTLTGHSNELSSGELLPASFNKEAME